MIELLPFSLHWKELLTWYFTPRSDGVRDVWRGRKGDVIVMRLSRPEDGPRIQQMVRDLSLQSRYQRFFYPVHELTPDMIERFTANAPGKAMNLVAAVSEDGHDRLVGMAQYVVGDVPGEAEFAVVVADGWQREGLGRRLVRGVVSLAREAGVQRLGGDVLADNEPMRGLMLELGFRLTRHPDGAYLRRAVKEIGVRGRG
ncbi:GNAT family N-acetyltransferase [Noviherbaspirillum galbum]|uniref:GNAT family N-acetyltransferase n=1 Tax=Noviherbaspirillum galbum TaxID=2709383 RepID=A0A6B3STF8_9BURK|nr:GNAT family N-acetyltransferase [Noviherbaspirillum galbum]NEX60909.1 GNAT family N-acetyltransferase [Noviherbaspirillum galbum]